MMHKLSRLKKHIVFCADDEEVTNGKSRSRSKTGRLASDSIVQQQYRPMCPSHSADLMKELSIRLQNRQQQAAAVRHLDASPSPPRSPIRVSRQPSYINEPLALKDDTSDDDDDEDGDYVKPSVEVPTNHVDRDDDDDDDNDDDTLSPRDQRRNKKCHDYINVLTHHIAQ